MIHTRYKERPVGGWPRLDFQQTLEFSQYLSCPKLFSDHWRAKKWFGGALLLKALKMYIVSEEIMHYGWKWQMQFNRCRFFSCLRYSDGTLSDSQNVSQSMVAGPHTTAILSCNYKTNLINFYAKFGLQIDSVKATAMLKLSQHCHHWEHNANLLHDRVHIIFAAVSFAFYFALPISSLYRVIKSVCAPDDYNTESYK